MLMITNQMGYEDSLLLFCKCYRTSPNQDRLNARVIKAMTVVMKVPERAIAYRLHTYVSFHAL